VDVRFSYKGERFDQTTNLMNKREAEAYERAFRTKLINGEVGIKTKKDMPNFKVAIAGFLEWSDVRQERNTYIRYATSAKTLIRFFGDQRVDRITVKDIEDFITLRSKEYGAPRGVKPKTGKSKQTAKNKISNATINRELACMKKMFSRLVADDTLSFNPVKQIQFLVEDNESGRVLNYEEERFYLMATSQPLQDYAAVLVETGLRPDELCRLTVHDVFIGGNRPYLMVRKGKTKSATRTVPLSERACGILSHRIAQAKGLYVFAGGRGGDSPNQPAVKFNNAHYGTLKRSDIDGTNRSGAAGKCTLYSFRHTFATRFLESEGDLLTLASLLGHSSLRMVMRYAHPSDAHKFDAIQRMEEKRANAGRKAA
jgi:integrase/recombinase XerD